MITSLLDTDQYKASMQQAVYYLFPNDQAEYRFINRGSHKFNLLFLEQFEREVAHLSELRLTEGELVFLRRECPYLSEKYLQYLYAYHFTPSQLTYILNGDSFELSINGPWLETILWEVPLLAIISEVYYKTVDLTWTFSAHTQKTFAKDKIQFLNDNDCDVIEFGTRRRRDYRTQSLFIDTVKEFPNFKGTSNLHFAHKYNIPAKGTNAHEWYQAISKLIGLKEANRFALKLWKAVYNNDLKVALSDTFGTDAFLEDFDYELASFYDGVRQDSGFPLTFVDKMLRHYCKLGIDPKTKIFLFSDNLNKEKAMEINKYVDERAKTLFGIGTYFTNDYNYQHSKALNVVIKLYKINNSSVAKLSDDEGKESGDPFAIEEVKRIFGRK